MITKSITYTDYNGLERTEKFYFNLSKAEIMEMEMSTAGGFAERINRIVAAQDQVEIIKVFKDLILTAYGEKSPDGKRFLKKAPDGSRLCDAFAETEAYSILFMELATDDKAAAAFINGVVPADMAKQVAASSVAPAAN